MAALREVVKDGADAASAGAKHGLA
jgi:hypothetical protein